MSEEENLQQMHSMVAELCKLFGHNPDEVHCDLWTLHSSIQEMREHLFVLGDSWDRVGRNARAGWEDSVLDRADAAARYALRLGRLQGRPER